MSYYTSPLLAFWGLTSTTWWLLWGVLTVLTVVLIVLLRTRWANAKSWKKCAVLSLWVHVLLGCVATTVRIVTGAPELGNDEPIRVSVRMVAIAAETPPTKEITPEWEQPSEPAMISPEALPLEAPIIDEPEALEPLPEPEPVEPAPPLEAPELLKVEEVENIAEVEEIADDSAKVQAEVAPEVASTPPTTSVIADGDVAAPSNDPPAPTDPLPLPTPTEKLPSTSEPKSLPRPAAAATQQNNAPPSPAKPTPVETELPETYANRFAKDRDALVEKRGGSEQTERAVRAALGWLANAQSDNGGWDASRFGAGAARIVLGEDRQGAGANADSGITGLALLAFLGSGHTHTGGNYTHEVAAGLEYLRQRQRSDGSLYGNAHFFARMYCHSMATFAVCEAYALTKDQRLKPMAQAAIRYTLSQQHTTDGGWRYQRGDTGDTSQLGWQLMTLKSAQLAGLEIPRVTWTRVDHFLRRVRRGRDGGLAAYRPNSPVSRSMTAEALFCRQLQQEQQQGQLSDAAVQEAVAMVAVELPTAERRNLYFWYYATLALQRSQNQSAQTAEAWEKWNHALTSALLSTQQDNGSWDTRTAWGGCGGQVYTTALSALCLEVYYRYNPAELPQEVANRGGWQSVHR